MKRLLLDTHALLWWLQGSERLGSMFVEQVSDPRNQVFLSAATTWEISIKRTFGTLSAPVDIEFGNRR